MKTALLLCSLLCCIFITKAQKNAEFITTDTKAQNIPSAETYSTASIAKYITESYKTDRERLRAIYSWVTYHIMYDSDSMYVINTRNDTDARITVALRRRKGVCENFAAIFNDIAVKCLIQSYEITGYTKQYGSIDKAAHTWCVVHLDGEWFFCDPTWDAGFSEYAKYYLVTPSLFIESHIPFDPLWQLLDYTVSHKEFHQGYSHSKEKKSFIHFTDSVNAYLLLNELQKLESAAFRIRYAGIANELIRIRLAWIQMQISIMYQHKDMIVYNAAVADLNQINTFFNDFVLYRNNRFVPKKADKEMKAIFIPIDDLLLAANKKLDELDKSPANFQYDPGILRNRLAAISNRISEQKDFLLRYFTSSLPEREKLFYE